MRRLFGVAALLVACSEQPLLGRLEDGGPPGPNMRADGDVSDAVSTDAADQTSSTTIYAVNAGAADLPPFRMCLDPKGHPLPNDPSHPMPLSNFPGVAQGGMASLGQVGSGPFVGTIFNALEVQTSPTDKSADCNTATNDGNLAYHYNVGSFQFQGAVQILVVHGSGTAPVGSLVTVDTTRYPPDAALHFQWANFASSTPGMVDASFGPKSAPADPLGKAAHGEITPLVSVAFMPSTPADYDAYGIQANGAFHSLTEIAHASDPTTTPGQFFGTRTNGYALVLIDDVGADAGKSQHFVAVPLTP
jgi:hypothetical protein